MRGTILAGLAECWESGHAGGGVGAAGVSVQLGGGLAELDERAFVDMSAGGNTELLQGHGYTVAVASVAAGELE